MATRLDIAPYNGGYMLIIETGGRRLPLIDGHTGDIMTFSKREAHGWQYGMRGTQIGYTIDYLLESDG